MSRLRLLDCSKLTINWKNENDVTVCWHDVIVYFFDVVLLLLSSLVTGPSFMSISPQLLELWQFSFVRDWSEIRKSEIPPSEFCPISGDWGKLGTSNLAQMSRMKCFWMQQNAWYTAFTVSESLSVNQQRGTGGLSPSPRLGLTKCDSGF